MHAFINASGHEASSSARRTQQRWVGAIRGVFQHLQGTFSPGSVPVDADRLVGSSLHAGDLALSEDHMSLGSQVPISNGNHPSLKGKGPAEPLPKSEKSMLQRATKALKSLVVQAGAVSDGLRPISKLLAGSFPTSDYEPYIRCRPNGDAGGDKLSTAIHAKNEALGTCCSHRRPLRGFGGPSFTSHQLPSVETVLQKEHYKLEMCHLRCGYPTWFDDHEIFLDHRTGVDIWYNKDFHPGKCYHDYRRVAHVPAKLDTTHYPTHQEVFCPTDDPLDQLMSPHDVIATCDTELTAHLSVAACFRERTVALRQLLVSKAKRYCDKIQPPVSWAWRNVQIPIAVAVAMEPSPSERLALAHLGSEPVLFNMLQANKPFREIGAAHVLMEFTPAQFLSLDFAKQTAVLKDTAVQYTSRALGFAHTLPLD